MASTKQKKTDIILVAIAMFLGGMVLGAVIMPQGTSIVYRQSSSNPPVQLTKASSATIPIPAVDAAGNGVIGYLTVQVIPGNGDVLLNVLNLTTLEGTQQSARDAVIAASAFTHIDLSNTDVIFNINVNATTIDGPSAGASMATATVLALENEAPKIGVVMTGTIDPVGNVGPVGAVLEKAQAAKANGAQEFVVPQGQAQDSQTVRSRQCNPAGNFCRVVYSNKPVDIANSTGLNVVQVSTLAEAVAQFTGHA